MLSDAGYAFSVASFTRKNLDVFLAITFVLGVMFDKVARFPFGDAEDLDLYFEDSLLDGVLGNASFFCIGLRSGVERNCFTINGIYKQIYKVSYQ